MLLNRRYLVNEIILSDLSVCGPPHLLDRAYRHGTWRLVDYRTEGFSGTMIYSGPGMDSGPLTLPLNREGYHAIYVGVHYPGFMDAHVRLRMFCEIFAVAHHEFDATRNRQTPVHKVIQGRSAALAL